MLERRCVTLDALIERALCREGRLSYRNLNAPAIVRTPGLFTSPTSCGKPSSRRIQTPYFTTETRSTRRCTENPDASVTLRVSYQDSDPLAIRRGAPAWEAGRPHRAAPTVACPLLPADLH